MRNRTTIEDEDENKYDEGTQNIRARRRPRPRILTSKIQPSLRCSDNEDENA